MDDDTLQTRCEAGVLAGCSLQGRLRWPAAKCSTFCFTLLRGRNSGITVPSKHRFSLPKSHQKGYKKAGPVTPPPPTWRDGHGRFFACRPRLPACLPAVRPLPHSPQGPTRLSSAPPR